MSLIVSNLCSIYHALIYTKKGSRVWFLSLLCVLVCLLVRLSAVEVLVDEFEHLFLVAVDVGTESAVAVRAEFLDYSVYHCRTEHVVLFKHCALAFEAVG